jgi:hypothetical protein
VRLVSWTLQITSGHFVVGPHSHFLVYIILLHMLAIVPEQVRAEAYARDPTQLYQVTNVETSERAIPVR